MKAAAVTAASSTTETDPVCGMHVDAAAAKAARLVVDHAGRTYYFCSDDCRKRFAAKPGQFLAR